MLGRRIKRLRNERGFSQKQLADRLGVRKQSVSNWENENAMPSMDKFLAMVELFRTTPNFMLGYEVKAGIDVTGLTENEIEHVAMLIDDLRSHHEKAE